MTKNYTIKDGKNLKEGQKTVTIEFEGKNQQLYIQKSC